MWLGVNRCQQCAWLPHSGGHGWWFEQMPPSTHTTPTDHTSPPPLKLLLYSMQSDKSNSEIGFANPNENHVQGENFHWRCMHLNNMCFGGFIATKKKFLGSWQVKKLAGKLVNWERGEEGNVPHLHLPLHPSPQGLCLQPGKPGCYPHT